MATDASKYVVVADAGPLIHLDELDALDVLNDFRQILISPAVHDELRKHRPTAAAKCPQLRFVYAPKPTESIDALALLYTLHRGEREALALCVEHRPALLLTDDTAARLAAKALGVAAHGTIGLLIRAVRMQHRSSRAVLDLLAGIPDRSTLHIRPALLQEVIADLKRTWGLT
jgi:predicted nucleic acid-binding protein